VEPGQAVSTTFRVEPLSEVLAAADGLIREATHDGPLRSKLLGLVAGRVIGEDSMLSIGLTHYQHEFGLSLVCSVETEDDTLLVSAEATNKGRLTSTRVGCRQERAHPIVTNRHALDSHSGYRAELPLASRFHVVRVEYGA
jgi:hypothetical protein